MQLERVAIADLKPHPDNYNRHPSVAKLTDSLRLNGQYKNIVVSSDGYIIAGHGLVMAAKELGIAELYAKREDCLHDSPEAQRILVADNLTPEESDPDNTALAALLSSLQQTVGLEGTGSDDVALDALIAELAAQEPQGNDVNDPGPGEPPQKAITQPGDVWVMGELGHRLVCGDSTDALVEEAARGGQDIMFLFTSPPYHVGKSYEKGQSWEQFLALLDDVFTLWGGAVVPGGYAFVNFAQLTSHPIAMAECYRSLFVDRMGWQWHCERAWKRPASIPYYAVSSPRPIGEVEHLHTYRKSGGGEEVVRDPEISRRKLWETGGPEHSEHDAPMPVDLAVMALAIYTDAGDAVSEPFGGTGTTIIACEKSGRRCVSAELEPRWCDTTICRYQDATGKRAVLEATGDPFPIPPRPKEQH